MKEYITYQSIKQVQRAIDKGIKVYWSTMSYEVIRDSIGQYLIHFTPEYDNYIGLNKDELKGLFSIIE